MPTVRRPIVAPFVALLVALPFAASVMSCAGERAPTDVFSSPVARADVHGFKRLDADPLRAMEEAERYRLFLESERSQPTYDSLKIEWSLETQGGSSLLQCEPLQYAGDVRIVGPGGGNLSIGPHKLRIPAGALASEVVITGEMPVSTRVGVELSPHGLVFLRPVELELSYKHCGRTTNAAKYVVHHTNGQIESFRPSVDRAKDGLVVGRLGHFSGYAIAHLTEEPQ